LGGSKLSPKFSIFALNDAVNYAKDEFLQVTSQFASP